jgi:hypothetical protein
MAVTPKWYFDQIEIYRIVNDFDQKHFKTDKPLRNDQAGRVVVITQVERKLSSLFPIDIVDKIMRHSLEDCPSVGALLMYYKSTPAIVALHPLPLSDNPDYINTASKSLLVQLNTKPSGGHLAAYHQLMTMVFYNYHDKLTFIEQFALHERKSPLSAIDSWNLSTGPTLPSNTETSAPVTFKNWWKTDFPKAEMDAWIQSIGQTLSSDSDTSDTDTGSSQTLQ